MQRITHKLKLKKKFLLIFMGACLLMCVGCLGAIQLMQQSYNEELYRANTKVLTLFAEAIQTELDRVVDDSENMISDSILQSALSSLANQRNDLGQRYQANNKVTDRIQTFDFYSEYIKSVYLVLEDGRHYGRFEADHTLLTDNLPDMIEAATEGKGQARWVFLPELEGSLILVRQIREKENFTLAPLATLMIKVDLDAIVKNANMPLLNSGGAVEISIFQDNIQIYTSGRSVSNLHFDDKLYHITDTEHGKVFSCVFQKDKHAWEYIISAEFSSIFRVVTVAYWSALLLLTVVVVLVVLLGNKLTKNIIGLIENLVLLCDSFAHGTYNPNEKMVVEGISRADEIGRLYRHFNAMAEENERMIQQVYEKQQLLLKTEIAGLRQQIGSHFIYNTLESIYCLAQLNEDDRIATLTSSLGKLLRSSLKEQRQVVPLKNDLDIALEYVKIQKIRLENRLSVKVDIAESYMDVPIPAMTLQPLVENAILHAAEEMLDTCEIQLYCRRDDHAIEVVVEDNGQGMDLDILPKLENGEITAKGLGIGLENINKRLKLLISPDSGVKIARENERTQVIIRLTEKEGGSCTR